jgi:hypothetical protein
MAAREDLPMTMSTPAELAAPTLVAMGHVDDDEGRSPHPLLEAKP